MSTKFFLILPLLLYITIPTKSQVTIGSVIPPNEGSLLDIKQHAPDANNINATKGLGLPRVALSTLTDISDMVSSPTDETRQAHIGLVVYNTIEDSEKCPGVYTWDGHKWSQMKIFSSNDAGNTIFDTDGNTYTYQLFGTKYWMTQNLRTTETPCETPLGKVYINPAVHGTSGTISPIGVQKAGDFLTAANISFKEDNSRTVPASDFAREFGLLYSQQQAKKACPTGWHLPTTAEWNDLATALGGTPGGNNNYDGVAPSAKADNHLYGAKDDSFEGTWGGTSPSGFNAHPSGLVSNDGQTASNFASESYFWAAGDGEIRILHQAPSNQALEYANNTPATTYASVRCVKN